MLAVGVCVSLLAGACGSVAQPVHSGHLTGSSRSVSPAGLSLEHKAILTKAELPSSWSVVPHSQASSAANRTLFKDLVGLAGCLHAKPVMLIHPVESATFQHVISNTAAPSGGTGQPSFSTPTEMGVQSNVWLASSGSDASGFVKILAVQNSAKCLQQTAKSSGHPLPGTIVLAPTAPKVGSASVSFNLSLGSSGSLTPTASTVSGAGSSLPAGVASTSSVPSGGTGTSSPALPLALPAVNAVITIFSIKQAVVAVFFMALNTTVPQTLQDQVLTRMAQAVDG